MIWVKFKIFIYGQIKPKGNYYQRGNLSDQSDNRDLFNLTNRKLGKNIILKKKLK